MEYVVIILLLATFIFVDAPALSDSSGMWTHFTYQFAHVGVLHLIVNMVVLYSLIKLLKRLYNQYYLILVIYAVSVIASIFAVYSTPTVGASGMAYACLGLFVGLVRMKKISFRQRSYQFIFYFGVAIGILISFLKGSSNTMLHIYSFVLAIAMTKSTYLAFSKERSSSHKDF